MSHQYPGYGELLNMVIHQRLVCHVQMTGSFVHEQDARLAVQCARQHNSLLLASAEAAAHIAYQSVVLHGHFVDFIVDTGHLGALGNAIKIDCGIEAGDIVGDGAGQ